LPSKPTEIADDVPEVVILRLPQYVRALGELLKRDVGVVSSQQLGIRLQMTPAQIRKDLSYFGRFGKQGRGYPVGYLLGELRQVLGLERKWNSCLVGVGRLGRAIISYPGFTPEGFNIVAAFDTAPDEVGQSIGPLVVQPIGDLARTIKERDIRIGIVAVPATQAQEVINQLVMCGVRGILNYAPVGPQVPDGVRVRNIDPILALQSMTYYLKPD
jgi:redox-sensing transcriptional repressor